MDATLESKTENAKNLAKKLKELKEKFDERVGKLDEKIAEFQELVQIMSDMADAARKGQIYQIPEDSKFKGASARKLKIKYEKLQGQIDLQKEKIEAWLKDKTKSIQDGMAKADDKIANFQKTATEIQSKASVDFLKQKAEDKIKAKLNNA